MTRRRMLGVLVGLLAAAAGLGVAEGLAAISSGPSPVYAVGTWAIDVSPLWLSDWAIEEFGANNKNVLVGGMLVTMALIAAVAGFVGTFARRTALALGAATWAVGVLAVATVRGVDDSPIVRVGPTVLGLLASTAALAWLLAVLPKPAAEPLRASGFVLTERTPPEPDVPAGPERPAVIVPGRVPDGFDRRGFLQAAGTVGAIAAIGGVAREIGGSQTSGLGAVGRLPAPFSPARKVVEADFMLPKLSPYFTANADFYRVDTSIVVPRLDARTWKLRITGMVENPLEITYDELLRGKAIERDITLTCVDNEVGGQLLGNARWLGIPIRDVLAAARPKPGADAVHSRSADGWSAGTPLSALTDPKRDSMFAIGMNGVPLPVNHGFPVRMVVPGHYGFVSATKWVTELEVTRFDAFEAYWTKRGWAAQAPIKTQSRIELPVPYSEIERGRTTIAGMAWAQHRGISKVEVQVSEVDEVDAPWRTARLTPWNNADTWRQWEIEWDLPLGTHNISVRATDGTGVRQPETATAPFPVGADGWHSVLTQVRKDPIA
ncbi:MAG: molybdopterin-dependent oxidoreductase [Sporichthyaceae bacterium]